MPKYKVVATGPVRLDPSINPCRAWLAPRNIDDRIISIAGVPMDQIPTLRQLGTGLGKDINPSGLESVGVRSELRIDDFEIEIVNA